MHPILSAMTQQTVAGAVPTFLCHNSIEVLGLTQVCAQVFTISSSLYFSDFQHCSTHGTLNKALKLLGHTVSFLRRDFIIQIMSIKISIF
jgi:hypothetical protein